MGGGQEKEGSEDEVGNCMRSAEFGKGLDVRTFHMRDNVIVRSAAKRKVKRRG